MYSVQSSRIPYSLHQKHTFKIIIFPLFCYRQASENPVGSRATGKLESKTKEAKATRALYESTNVRARAKVSSTKIPLGARERTLGTHDMPHTDPGENLVSKSQIQAETTRKRARGGRVRQPKYGARHSLSHVRTRWFGVSQPCRELYDLLSAARGRILQRLLCAPPHVALLYPSTLSQLVNRDRQIELDSYYSIHECYHT